jgi:T5SS/PEP-CTERM-associated repeat protein
MDYLVNVRCVGQRWFLCHLLPVVSLVTIASQVIAADRFWIDPTGGGYTSSSNWLGGFAALDGDVAHFGVTNPPSVPPATYTVGIFTNIKIQLLVVEDDAVTFDLHGHSYETTGNATTAMIIGNVSSRPGQFTVTNGIAIAPFQSHVSVGNLGTGLLTVTTGGLLIGSPHLTVGSGANGTLTINGGGDLIADNVEIAVFAANTGTATITGASSSLLAATLDVGQAGSGFLNVLASGCPRQRTSRQFLRNRRRRQR